MNAGDIDSVNHVGVAVRDMGEACIRYEALGFTLSPLSVHSGSKTPGAPVERWCVFWHVSVRNQRAFALG